MQVTLLLKWQETASVEVSQGGQVNSSENIHTIRIDLRLFFKIFFSP